MDKLTFFLSLMLKYATGQNTECPYCASSRTSCIQRKKVLLQLRRCEGCSLLFRYPKNDQEENWGFYQKKYVEPTVTDLPPTEEIAAHKATRFVGVGRDLTEHLKTVKAIAPNGRLLDYGCSWGYCVYQFREAGYDTVGFEISRPRVDYGHSVLDVNLTSDIEQFPDASFDVIYSAHVLEHIPSPRSSFQNFQRLLKPGGTLFIYVPNCAGSAAKRLGIHWPTMINEKHVLALTAEFFQRNLPSYGFTLRFSSSPYSEFPRIYGVDDSLEGEELLVVGKRT